MAKRRCVEDDEAQTLQVVKYCGDDGGVTGLYPFHHECIRDDGTRIYVDLMIDGTFPKDVTPESLVGKRVRVEWMHSNVAVAHNPSIDGGAS